MTGTGAVVPPSRQRRNRQRLTQPRAKDSSSHLDVDVGAQVQRLQVGQGLAPANVLAISNRPRSSMSGVENTPSSVKSSARRDASPQSANRQ